MASGKTDRQTDKSSRWQFTAYQDQWDLFKQMPPGIAEWGWQQEQCPKTQKLHYQGYLRTPSQVRFSALKKILPGVHIEVAKNWQALLNYCQKLDTRVEGEAPVHVINTYYTQYTYAEKLGRQLYDLYKLDFEDWSDQTALQYIEQHARLDIRAGHREIMWIISNPNWKVAWKYWKDIISSYSINATPESSWTRQTPPQPQSQTPPSTPRPKPGDVAHTDREDHGNN